MHNRVQASGAWGERIPDDEWKIYRSAIDLLQREAIPFAIGGAFALAAYSNLLRNTKDLDFYILEADCPRVVDVFERAGLSDYYGVEAYDRGWLYRGHRESVIVDAIWGMPNRRAKCTQRWMDGGPEVTVRGRQLRIIPPEELIFAKIFIVQRPRCDWPDIINLIFSHGPQLDWDHLIRLLGPDVPLLRSILHTFCWLAPGRAQQLPGSLWESVGVAPPEAGPAFDEERVLLLETRPWFAPMMARTA